MTDTLKEYTMTKMKKINKYALIYGLKEKLTDEQEVMIDSILNNRLTMVNASAGSGKTTIAVAIAKYLYETEGQRLTYVFSPVQERSMGFRPGTQEEKELEYLQPLVDALMECGEQNVKEIIESNTELYSKPRAWIEAKSHIFVRGTNLKGRTVIIDEAQNFTRGDLKKLLTRIHDDCTVIMIGHTGQCDLPNAAKSGFAPYIKHFKDEPYAQELKLTQNFRGVLSRKADELEWD